MESLLSYAIIQNNVSQPTQQIKSIFQDQQDWIVNLLSHPKNSERFRYQNSGDFRIIKN